MVNWNRGFPADGGGRAERMGISFRQTTSQGWSPAMNPERGEG
jgi:hypothetical protein